MTTILSIQITVNEAKVSPARVTEEMVKGFVFLREGYFGLHEPDLSLSIETLTVSKPKRERHSRRVERQTRSPRPNDVTTCPTCGNDLIPQNGDLWCFKCNEYPDLDSGQRYPDYPSIRIDSEHEEHIVNSRAVCDVCGFVDELDPIKDRAAINQWHGDSFGLVE